MIYTVKRIDEDLDFGCEERAKDAPVMAVVTLVDSSGEELRVKAEDALLYKNNINEGDKVCYDKNDPDSVYQIPGGTIQVTDYRKVKADEIPASKYTTVFYSDDSDYWLITLTASFEDADRYIIDLNLSPQIEFVPTEGSPTTCGTCLQEPFTV